MDHSATRRINSQSLFTVAQGERRNRLMSTRVNFDTVVAAINDLVFAKRGKYLSEPEIIVLRGAWDNDDYKEMAENSPYSVNYLQRRIAPPLWNLLSQTVGSGERVSKKRLRYSLEEVTKKYHSESVLIQEQVPSVSDSATLPEAQLPDISSFHGRLHELTQLKEALIKKKRCVSIVGVAGIGKSALVAKLIEEIGQESSFKFDYVIWKSVAHAPSIQDLLTDLILLTGNLESGFKLPKYTQAMITTLIKQVQLNRCLVILDECEELFQIDNLEQRLEYKVFFRRLIEEEHQSTFVLTSRIWPNEFDVFIEADRPVQFLRIEGLDIDAAMKFLSDQGLSGQENHYKELIEIYRGNPAAMKAVANKINHFFAGSTETFLKNKTTFISGRFREMLDEMFGQVLNDFQQKIMLYLAEETITSSSVVGFNELLDGLKQKYELTVSTSELITALELLEKQSLIESNKDPNTKQISFSLQPMIKKYIKKVQMGLLGISDSSRLAIAS